MKMRLPGFDQELVWTSTQHVNELIVENSQFFRRIIQDFYQHEDDGSGISLIDQGQALDFASDIETVINPTQLDFNNRRVTLNFFKLLTQASLNENNYLPTQELKATLASYLVDLVESTQINFQIGTDDFALTQLAKAVNLHLISDENFLTRLIEYQEVMRELGKVKLTVWINLRSFLTNEQLQQLLAANNERELNALLLESTPRQPIRSLPRMIIDKQLCQI
ncbi:type II-A CRISPR-associated protein Csn2 [bacterium]|nr:type II-A CRISPR-associated protein Csn2 [bacterium]